MIFFCFAKGLLFFGEQLFDRLQLHWIGYGFEHFPIVLNILSMDKAFHSQAFRQVLILPVCARSKRARPHDDFIRYQMLEWKPIATAPAHVELELSVYDKGEYHALVFPCERDGMGWRDVEQGRHFLFEPTHWRPWKKNTD